MRKWLIEMRQERGITQKVMSESVGISQPAYCNIENGERRPSVDTAIRIGEILEFDWTRFFEGRDKED